MNEILRVYFYNIAYILIFAWVYFFTAKYYGTEKDKRNFDNYEDTLYYTVITHFTIGFGDVAPESLALRRATMVQVIASFYLLKMVITKHAKM